MSQNSLNNSPAEEPAQRQPYRWWLAIVLPLWVFIGFVVAQSIVVGLLLALNYMGMSLVVVSEPVLSTIAAALTYVLGIIIVLGVPWVVKKRRTTMQDIGLLGLPTWKDIGFAPVGFILYLFASGILVYGMSQLFSEFNISQAQEVGFNDISQTYEYLLAFVTLVVIAPIAEEVLFRGYLYGKLRRAVPVWMAIIVTSVLFGAIHGQWNVGVDVFALSVIVCILREVTGSIWAGILLHMMKNGLAFYILFINTSFLVQ